MCIMFRDKWIILFFKFPFCGDFTLHLHKMVKEISRNITQTGLIWAEDIPSYIFIQWDTFDFVTEHSFDLINNLINTREPNAQLTIHWRFMFSNRPTWKSTHTFTYPLGEQWCTRMRKNSLKDYHCDRIWFIIFPFCFKIN